MTIGYKEPKELAKHVQKVLANEQEYMCARFLRDNPECKIEDVQLVTQIDGSRISFWIERKR